MATRENKTLINQEQANSDKAKLDENNSRQAEAAAANVTPQTNSVNKTANEVKTAKDLPVLNKPKKSDSEVAGKSGYEAWQQGQLENAQELLDMIIDFQKMVYFRPLNNKVIDPISQLVKNEISAKYSSLTDRIRAAIDQNSDKAIDKESTSQSKEDPQTIKMDNEIQQNKIDQEKNETGILTDGFGEDIETLYNEKKTEPVVLSDGFGENIETLYEDHTEKTIAAVDESWEKNKIDDKNISSEAPQLDIENKNIPKN